MDRSPSHGQDSRPGPQNPQANRPTSPPPPSTPGYTPPTSSSGSHTTAPAPTIAPPTAPDPVAEVKQAGSQAVEQVQQALSGVVGDVQEKATGRVSEKIEEAAKSLSDVVKATRSVGQQLRQNDQPGVAQLADQAAGQVERVASYLQGKDLEQLMHESESFARRQPVVFLSGAFVLGLLAARFVKSSSKSGMSSMYQQTPSRAESYGQAVMHREGSMQVGRLRSNSPSSTAAPARLPV